MAHGYLREYDEGWDRGDDRERADRDWRNSDRDRNRDWSERDRGRGFMFGDEDRGRFRDRDEERGRYRNRDEDRGFFSRAGNEARSWFGDDDRSDRGAWENNRDWPQRDRATSGYGREQRGFGGSNEWRENRGYSSNPDDHYRSWRDRQMQSLDRDYQDYCREREQQFHQDFDKWRQNRQPTQQGQQQSAMTQQSQPGGSNQDELILGSQQQTQAATAGNTPSPADAATLGTNNSENSGTGRGRR